MPSSSTTPSTARRVLLGVVAAIVLFTVVVSGVLVGARLADPGDSATQNEAGETRQPAALPDAEGEGIEPAVAAFTTVYTGATSASERLQAVRDGGDLTTVTQDAFTQLAAQLTTMTIDIRGAEQLDADRVAVAYTLVFPTDGTSLPVRAGMAVRTPDGWKVARTTYCEDLTLAQVVCPADPNPDAATSERVADDWLSFQGQGSGTLAPGPAPVAPPAESTPPLTGPPITGATPGEAPPPTVVP